ncbi:Voltage-Dependent R-Type Calcium Channel Subunit Alpha-1E [Manis pentadactyla]|nr:Voltage-Dependent R-Type Calcium Channel Subunit Alpha-1E [Manis pentadactyla]
MERGIKSLRERLRQVPRAERMPRLRTAQSSTSALLRGLLNLLTIRKIYPPESQMLFSPHWLCTEHHYLRRASVSMAITDGKCCGIIHVLERRHQGREGGGWREHDPGAGQWGLKEGNVGVGGIVDL